MSPSLGPARTLDEVQFIFDPREPLEGEALKAYYAERNTIVRRLMINSLRVAERNPVKILFTGHSGSGKSTELNKLIEDVSERFFVVKVRTGDIVSPTSLTYIDVILIVAMELFRSASDAGVISKAPAQIVGDVWDNVTRMINNVIFGKVPYRKPAPVTVEGVTLGASVVQGLTLEFEARFRDDANTREKIREHMKDQLSEVIAQMNLISGEVRHRYGKPVLIIVEDTDKPDVSRAREIFFEHPQTLVGYNASVIYTFPIELRHSVEYQSINRYFLSYRMPNLVLTDRAGNRNPAAWDVMGFVLARRMDSALIAPDAIESLIAASGGLMRLLIRLTQNAALRAFTRGAKKIEDVDVKQAISEVLKDFQSALRMEDFPYLADRHVDHWLNADERLQYLLRLTALVEYENGDEWCDVHPILLPTVIERTRHDPG